MLSRSTTKACKPLLSHPRPLFSMMVYALASVTMIGVTETLWAQALPVSQTELPKTVAKEAQQEVQKEASAAPISTATQKTSTSTPIANTKSNTTSTTKSTTNSTISPPLVAKEIPLTTMRAEQLTGQPENFVELEHEVFIKRGDTNFSADKVRYNQVLDELFAIGKLRLQRQQDCYRGDTLQMKLETGAGEVNNATYVLGKNNAQGQAKKIVFENEQRSTIVNGTYTTCQSLDPDWYLTADTFQIDSTVDQGVATKAVLYFKGVPIFGSPSFIHFSFPLSGARQSGLLPPTVSHSNKGGWEFGIPYYFNLAPNRDLTLHPNLIARRGLQLGVDARYLDESYSGQASIEGMPHDSLANRSRYTISSKHQHTLYPNVDLAWNLNRASDDDYPSDFSNSSAKTAQRLLVREIGLNWYGDIWSANLRTTSYQVLQDITSRISKPYERLPQINFRAAQMDVAGFDWAFDAQATRFSHPTLINGERLVLNPQVSYPIVFPAFFLIPKVSLHATSYQLKPQTPQALATPDQLQRVLPTVSLDSGLVFERESSLFGRPMIQTLEPRLFYVKTPYRDQSTFPIFDTAEADFNFAQIFSENRFTGNDRIADSNQVTAALVSRFIENDGAERLKFALGQRFYFNTQRVNLGTGQSLSRSDMLLAATGQVNSALYVDGSVQVSQSDRRLVRSTYGVRWQPAPKKVLNLQYNFQRDVLKQLELSGQWPIAQRWFAAAKANYSLQDNKLVEGLAGLEYRADCWSLRLMAQRFSTANAKYTSGFSIQLELNGLGRLGFGANPLEAMKKNISGYQVQD
jgi:LPS-assembly protein